MGVSTLAARWALPLLLFGIFAIGFSAIFVRLSDVGPVATAVNRLGLPLPFYWAALLTRPREAALTRRAVALMVLAGVFFAGDLAVWHWSLKLTSVANSTLLANISPALVIVAAWVMFGERVGGTFIAGGLIALAGVVLLVGRSFAVASPNLAGDLLAIVTAFFYAGYLLTTARIRKQLSALTLMTISGTAATAILVPLALATDHVLWPSTLQGWFAAAGLAIVSQ